MFRKFSLSRIDRARARSIQRRILTCFLTTLFIAGGIPPAGSEEPSDTQPETEAAVPPSGRTEIVDERTLTSRTYRTPNGSLEMDVYPGPIHYEAPSGDLETIDNTLIPTDRPGYAYENAANAYKVLIPESLDEKPVRIEIGGEWISYSLDGASGTPVVEGDRVTFPDALDGVDLSYTVLNTGVEEDLTLESQEAPPAYTFDLAVSQGVRTSERSDESIVFKDPVSEETFAFAPPIMFEEESEDDISSAVSLDITKTGSDLSVELNPRDRWLDSPQRDYPVVVDPTWTYNQGFEYGDDCWIGNDTTEERDTSHCGQLQLRTGYFSQDAAKRRTLIEFRNLDEPLSEDLMVSDATLRLCVTETLGEDSSNHTAIAVKTHRVTESWANPSWNKRKPGSNVPAEQPWATAGGSFIDDPTDSNLSVGGSVNKYEYWHPVGAVQRWLDGRESNFGFLLKSNESQNQVVRFASFEYPNTGSPEGVASNCNSGTRPRAPKLTIEFTYRPEVPTGLTPSAGTFTNDSTPTLTGVYQDAEQADDGYAEFEVLQGGTVVRSGRSPGTGAVMPDTSVSWTPSTALTTEGAYEWHARNCDGQMCSAWSALRGFTLDNTPPTTPVILDRPDDPSPDVTPEWAFRDEDELDMQEGTTFECRMTKSSEVISPYSSCSSPVSFDLSGSGAGNYTFSVREKDPGGLLSTEASHSFSFNPSVTGPPEFTAAPDDPVTGTSASFSFTGDAGSTFECQLASGDQIISAYSACSSPHNVSIAGMQNGSFEFSVRQKNSIGLTSAPETLRLGYYGEAPPPGYGEVDSAADRNLDSFLIEAEGLLGNRYGDAWIDYEQNGDIVASVGVVGLTAQDTDNLIDIAPVGITVEPVSVQYSEDELDEIAEQIDAVAGDEVSAIATAPEVNKVELVMAPEDRPLCETCMTASWAVPSDAIFESTTPIPTEGPDVETRSTYPPYKAGKGITTSAGTCSAGFEMVLEAPPTAHAGAVQGSTNDHCFGGNDTVKDMEGHVIGHGRRWGDFSGDNEVKMDVTLFGMHPSEKSGEVFVDDSLSRRVVDKLSWKRMDGGLLVYKSGFRTGITRGHIWKKFVRQTVSSGRVYHKIVCAGYGSDLGDSGGAVYRPRQSDYANDRYSAVAVGIHRGTATYPDATYRCFEPIGDVEKETNSHVRMVD